MAGGLACGPRGPPRQSPGRWRRASGAAGAALIISKWAGYYGSAFTQRTYIHASDDDLQQGQSALARIHKIA